MDKFRDSELFRSLIEWDTEHPMKKVAFFFKSPYGGCPAYITFVDLGNKRLNYMMYTSKRLVEQERGTYPIADVESHKFIEAVAALIDEMGLYYRYSTFCETDFNSVEKAAFKRWKKEMKEQRGRKKKPLYENRVDDNGMPFPF